MDWIKELPVATAAYLALSLACALAGLIWHYKVPSLPTIARDVEVHGKTLGKLQHTQFSLDQRVGHVEKVGQLHEALGQRMARTEAQVEGLGERIEEVSGRLERRHDITEAKLDAIANVKLDAIARNLNMLLGSLGGGSK